MRVVVQLVPRRKQVPSHEPIFTPFVCFALITIGLVPQKKKRKKKKKKKKRKKKKAPSPPPPFLLLP